MTELDALHFAPGHPLYLLSPVVVGARLFKADLANAPTLEAIADRCLELDAVARAHPLRQPGAPPA